MANFSLRQILAVYIYRLSVRMRDHANEILILKTPDRIKLQKALKEAKESPDKFVMIKKDKAGRYEPVLRHCNPNVDVSENQTTQ